MATVVSGGWWWLRARSLSAVTACSSSERRGVDDSGRLDAELCLESLQRRVSSSVHTPSTGAVQNRSVSALLYRCGVRRVGEGRLLPEVGQLLVERPGGRLVDESRFRKFAVGLQPLHGIGSQGTIDSIDLAVEVPGLLQRCLHRRGVRRDLCDGLGLLFIGQAPGVGDQLHP